MQRPVALDQRRPATRVSLRNASSTASGGSPGLSRASAPRSRRSRMTSRYPGSERSAPAVPTAISGPWSTYQPRPAEHASAASSTIDSVNDAPLTRTPSGSTGVVRNSSIGMPSPPTRSRAPERRPREGGEAGECSGAGRSSPRSPRAARRGPRSPPRGCARASRRARTRPPPRRSPGARRPRTRPGAPTHRGRPAVSATGRPDCAVIRAVLSTWSFGLEPRCRTTCPAYFWSPTTMPGAGEQVEVVRERRRVARVLQLAEHLRVGEDLPRVRHPSSNRRRSSAGLSTRVSRSTSREIVVSIRESSTYRRQRRGSADERRRARVAAEVEVLRRATSRTPRASRRTTNAASGGPRSGRRDSRSAPARSAAAPSRGARPARRGPPRCPRPRGASRTRTSRGPSGPRRGRGSPPPARARPAARASHCSAIHRRPRRVGSSALAYRTGTPTATRTCRTSVRLAHLPRPGHDLDEAPGLAQARLENPSGLALEVGSDVTHDVE